MCARNNYVTKISKYATMRINSINNGGAQHMGGFVIGILILSIVIVLVRAIFSGVEGSKHYFACGNCGKKFQPQWTQMCFNVHVFNEHALKCPHCGMKGLCTDKGKAI